MTSHSPIRTIFFDLGSTLMYYDGQWPDALYQAIEELGAALQQAGLRLNLAEFLPEFQRRMNAYFIQRDDEYLEYTTEHILQNLLADVGHPDVPVELQRGALRRMYAITQAHWHREADTLPTLEALKAAGYRLGLISNASDAADVHALIDKAQIRPYFQSIVISAEIGRRKPAAQIFEVALRETGSTPDESLMVGDWLPADVAGAHNLGMRAVWIARHVDTLENRALAEQLRPEGIVHTLSELPALLERWKMEG